MNQKATTTLECVGENQIDITILVSNDEFEAAVRNTLLLKNLKDMIIAGLGETKIKDIEAAEFIGGASRVKVIQNLATEIFGERITKRLNPDEAVGVGLGWIGAIRSTKYKVPYDIQITDIITNLHKPISFSVFNEKNEQILAKPLEMFKNGEIYPKSKKVTLRFAPGKYVA